MSFADKTVPEPNSGCLLWLGAIDTSGYGCVWQPKRRSNLRAHRVAWEIERGPIPAGMELDHLCRVRSCVNVNHLECVTPHENWMRGRSFSRMNRERTHCPSGHPYSGENLYVNPNGRRECRACVRIRDKRRAPRVR